MLTQTAVKPAAKPDVARRKLNAALHIHWKQFYRGEESESRSARLEWLSRQLGYKRTIKSANDLTDRQLALAVDKLAKAVTPTRPAMSPKPAPTVVAEAKIIHLASAEQVYALELIARYLRWDSQKISNFLFRRWKRRTFNFLTAAQANDATAIFLSVACGTAIRATRGDGKPVTRDDIRAAMVDFKCKIGLDTVLLNRKEKL